ncbi:hypothetical protein FB567DRAFT_616620 [Paraphoma chrysanthemicola]|uniref:Uncharacterized protein n=1 Tax=Paraphoma chrysanthemicola TaxID=798071 RepID=A0A8K0W1W5_9PLEO|nr:hypothetical protein FB567DRAFT_616620 [Paraphoma chrysanthemicola]
MEPASPFLRLPGEVRNCIYAYALSEPKGVYHREDADGVSWLCLHDSTTDKPVATTNKEVITKRGRAKRRKLNNGLLQNVQVDAKSESRDMRVRACDNLYIVANQMAFVSHQLRFETKGLGLRYNVLYIFKDSYHDVIQTCMSCTKQQRRWLEIIKVTSEPVSTKRKASENEPIALNDSVSHEGMMRDNLILTELVADCPRLAIHAHIPDIKRSSKYFLTFALVMQCCGRGNLSFIDRFSSDALIQSALKEYFDTIEAKDKQVLQFIPCMKVFHAEEAFDEAMFRKNCEEKDLLAIALRGDPNYDIEKLVTIAREWYLYGV